MHILSFLVKTSNFVSIKQFNNRFGCIFTLQMRYPCQEHIYKCLTNTSMEDEDSM